MLDSAEVKRIETLCNETRKNVLLMIYNAQSGHIGGAFSSVELLTVLYQKCMKTVPAWKKDVDFDKRDRFVLSKGHASSALYCVLAQLGYFPKEELMTFRKFGSKLQGHPNTKCEGVEVPTGSLGQGLSISCGIATALKLDKNPANVFVLIVSSRLLSEQIYFSFISYLHF